MRIVLLGATGFVGHHLLPALSAAGHDCVALTRYKPGCRDLQVIPRVEILQMDVYDPDRLADVFAGADAVINMVGILNESGRSGKGFHKAHVELMNRIIDACHATGVRRVLYVSALNAGKGQSHYLISKGEAEQALRDAPDIDETIVQPSVIFGDGDSFFNRFSQLLTIAPVMPLACPNARLQPVWVGDVAAMVTAAIFNPETVGQTLIAVGPQDYSLRELVEYTACVRGLRRKVVGLPDALSRLQGFVMDFVPGKPFSSDNYKSLQTDNTSVENSLWNCGISPRSIESIVPGYLCESPHQQRLDECRRQVES